MSEQPKGVTLVLTDRKINVILLGVPNSEEYEQYLEFFKSKKVKHLFIATNYDNSLDYFSENGLTIHKIEFEDGNAPPQDVIDSFLEVYNNPEKKSDEFIAVACKRGYGRAPTLAALAMIEHGYSPVQTLNLLRKYNPRFITERQKQFILNYHSDTAGGCCRI